MPNVDNKALLQGKGIVETTNLVVMQIKPDFFDLCKIIEKRLFNGMDKNFVGSMVRVLLVFMVNHRKVLLTTLVGSPISNATF